jgi:hypothetical protein
MADRATVADIEITRPGDRREWVTVVVWGECVSLGHDYFSEYEGKRVSDPESGVLVEAEHLDALIAGLRMARAALLPQDPTR